VTEDVAARPGSGDAAAADEVDGGGQPVQAGQMTNGRRSYLKWLIALAVGIPVALEASTFFGLLGGQVGEEQGLAVGDDLLAETDRPETVDELAFADGRFELAVRIENTGNVPYGVTVSSIQLSDDESVDDPVAVGPVGPGEAETLAGSWTLPGGTTPTALEVVAREYTDGREQVVAASTVRLDVDD
jgi:hypothetical protein